MVLRTQFPQLVVMVVRWPNNNLNVSDGGSGNWWKHSDSGSGQATCLKK